VSKLVVFAITLVLGALTVAGVSAGGPQIQTQTLNAADVPWGPTCGGEAILASYTVTRRVENFFDGSALVLQRRHVTGAGTVTLPSTGRSLPYEFDFTVTTDFITQASTITGQQAHVIVPGDGAVFLNSGRAVLDASQFPPPLVAEAGPHGYFDPDGTDAVCAALGA
jgi:hypothetical protein